ncbi:MAG: nuclease SbcCD subunit C, partial [Myxococcales bacterium]|nr:nuclease SbcCD subunit C [Myxococcales bacterium]
TLAALDAAQARAAEQGRWAAAGADARHALGRAEDHLAVRTEGDAQARAAAQSAQAELAALQAERAAVLGGRDAQAVADGLLRAIQAAQARVSDARTAHEAAQAALAKATAAQDRAEGAWHGAERAARRAADALAAELRDLGLGEAQARRRLGELPPDPAAEAAALDALDAAVHRAEAVAQQRANDAQAVAGEAPAVPGVPPVEAALAQARALRDAARRAVEAVVVRLAQDTEARARHLQLSESLDRAAAEARVWAELDELIGSHDGSRFRDFAQSLTLEAVIGQANHHLLELNPRYALMRVPNKDLDLQVVDRDLGDEIRPIESLSGGEGFLVSLALALGLASLSARDTRIDSLFIDEGLGTLDVDTLDKVLDALDALQATGRQVGLISHVPGLAERIGARVRVQPQGAGVSAVAVEGPGAGWAAA